MPTKHSPFTVIFTRYFNHVNHPPPEQQPIEGFPNGPISYYQLYGAMKYYSRHVCRWYVVDIYNKSHQVLGEEHASFRKATDVHHVPDVHFLRSFRLFRVNRIYPEGHPSIFFLQHQLKKWTCSLKHTKKNTKNRRDPLEVLLIFWTWSPDTDTRLEKPRI